MSVLVIGYGNPDREDDGVAWHIVERLADHFQVPVSIVDEAEAGHHLHLAVSLQLTPEMAEPISTYDLVCFVDAHTGAYDEAVRLAPVEPVFQSSPFTHHLTPESCLTLAQTLYGQTPQGMIVSVRGYEFGYSSDLSERTAALAEKAADQLIEIINQEEGGV